MKRILINATQAEELRVAMVNGQLMYDLDIEVPSREQKKSNIYKGVITRVEPSLEAAFVNYGAERHGFLPFKEISKIYFAEGAKSEGGRYNIKDAVKEGQQIIVQVEKEERGNKGAALTSFISLAGRFLVSMPHNPRAGGVSRRIEGEDREQIRQVMSEIEMPTGMGIIARTAGVGRTTEEMQWDLDYLTQLWGAIEKAAEEQDAPFLIYQESDIVIRALRDHYKSDIGEVLIDSQTAYDRAHEFMSMVMPNALHKLKKFEDKLPLFNRYQIENQIESAFARSVNLPSGGSIVIDHTEALTAIDINSARATKGSDIEDTALNTNLEAADEIARQLRIRDLGGLVVIDFIDMLKNKNQRDVEQRLRNAVHEDRARVQIGRISRFGLMEMSRQRLRPSLGESSQIVCPRCSGHGSIRDVESLSLSVLRLLEEDALKENTGRIVANLPVECATYLLNEKRNIIADIEERNSVHCVIVPDPNLETPHFKIERVRDDDTLRHESNYKSSYEMTTEEAAGYTPAEKPAAATPAQTAVVQRITPAAKPESAAPKPVEKEKQGGLFSKVINVIFGNNDKTEEAKPEEKPEQNTARRNNNRNRNRPAQNRNRNNRNQNQNKRNNNRDENKRDDQVAANSASDNKPNEQKESSENRPRNQKPRNNRNRNQNRQRRQNTDSNQNTTDQQNDNKPSTETQDKSTPQKAVQANPEVIDSKEVVNNNTTQAVDTTSSTPNETKPASTNKGNEEKPRRNNRNRKPRARPQNSKPETANKDENPNKTDSPSPKVQAESTSTNQPVKEKPAIPVSRNVSSVNTPSFAKPAEKDNDKVDKASKATAPASTEVKKPEAAKPAPSKENTVKQDSPEKSSAPAAKETSQPVVKEKNEAPKKTADSKPVEVKAEAQKPAVVKSVDSKPAEVKKTESKAVESKAASSKSESSKADSAKPSSSKPVSSKAESPKDGGNAATTNPPAKKVDTQAAVKPPEVKVAD